MRHSRPTVADIRALKGQRQLSMLYVDTPEEAAAASEAGIDMLSIIDPVWTPEMRAAAGSSRWGCSTAISSRRRIICVPRTG